MWELDHKESWVLKNWCFWTVVLEKTLESPLDCTEIQPVNPKGNQSWIFIGRTDAEAEALILVRLTKSWTWLSDWTDWLTVWLFVTPWTAVCQASHLSLSPRFAQTPVHCVDDVIQPSYPLTPAFLLLPSNFPNIQVFSNKPGLRIRWPKYWSFSFSISLSNEYSGLISFRIDWLDLLAVQGTLKSLLQHHSSKASILRCSAFFIVQLSHPYLTAGKTIALTR